MPVQNGYIAEMTLATRCGCSRSAAPSPQSGVGESHAEHDAWWWRSCAATAPAAAMRAHIELVRGEYELYAVSV